MLPLKTVHFPSLNSTMTWAREHAEELDLVSLTRITADEQTGGRGQFGRSWHSPPGNLYATFCFTVPVGWPDLPHAAQMLILSAAKVLEGYDLNPRIKWPNDLQLRGKKVGGVLCEVESRGDRMLLVNGIGLNVNLSLEGCDRVDQPTTSLALELSHSVEVGEITDRLTTMYQADLDLFLREGFGPFKEAFEEKLIHRTFG